MKTISSYLTSVAPGRVVLYGEHSDYLGLPAISLAVNLHIIIKGSFANDVKMRYNIDMPNIAKHDSFSALNNGKLRYKKRRDYLRSVVNVLARQYNFPPRGMDVSIDGRVPISGGLSSSTALVVAWTNFLLHMYNQTPDEPRLADLAYLAEVVEFQESGGKQDHLSVVYGNLNLFDFYPEIKRTPIAIPKDFPAIIVGFMGRKDTLGVLSRIRWKIFDGMKKMTGAKTSQNVFGTLQEMSVDDINLDSLKKEDYLKIKGTLLNRDLTREGFIDITKPTVDWPKIGHSLLKQHEILSQMFRISTPVIDHTIQRVTEAGAYGGKISGSGGGGSFICLVPPEKVNRVKDTIKEMDGRYYDVKPSEGAKVF